MAFPWVDIVGPTLTNTLAKQCSVEITPDLVRFLNLFGEHMDAIMSPRRVSLKNRSKHDNVPTNLDEIMQAEVKRFRESRREQEIQIEQLDVIKRPGTYIPSVHCKLKALPLLVIKVTRSYAVHRLLVSPTWRLAGDAHNKLLGRAQSAVNHVANACKECKHQISISGVLNMWFAQGLRTSRSENFVARASSKGPSKMGCRLGDVKDSRLSSIERQETRSDVSSCASDKSGGTASTFSRRGISSKRISPHISDTDNFDSSRRARKRWQGEHRTTPSNTYVLRPAVDSPAGPRVEQSTRSNCDVSAQNSRPVTNADLRASVNAALNSIDTSNKKASQPRIHDEEASVGSFSTPTNLEVCRGNTETAANIDSSNMVLSSEISKADGGNSFASGSGSASASMCPVSVTKDVRDNRESSISSAADRSALSIGEARSELEESLRLPSDLIEGVTGVGVGEEWVSHDRVGTSVCDELEKLCFLQANSKLYEFEEYVRRLD
eukprot:GFKZ01011327.1.p1 GENE.GFKZ01011327.1~~GFKZ01011327.1.p1  ORF type:complete len:494 (-),score=41.73 GFKZ01011327.1:952-2433(-)